MTNRQLIFAFQNLFISDTYPDSVMAPEAIGPFKWSFTPDSNHPPARPILNLAYTETTWSLGLDHLAVWIHRVVSLLDPMMSLPDAPQIARDLQNRLGPHCMTDGHWSLQLNNSGLAVLFQSSTPPMNLSLSAVATQWLFEQLLDAGIVEEPTWTKPPAPKRPLTLDILQTIRDNWANGIGIVDAIDIWGPQILAAAERDLKRGCNDGDHHEA